MGAFGCTSLSMIFSFWLYYIPFSKELVFLYFCTYILFCVCSIILDEKNKILIFLGYLFLCVRGFIVLISAYVV